MHRIGGQSVFAELSADCQAQSVCPSAGGVLLVSRGPVGRTHHGRVTLSTGPVVVAHLDRTGESTPVRPVEAGRLIRSGIVRLVTEQTAVVHPGWLNNLAGIEQPFGINSAFDVAEDIEHAIPEHDRMKFRSDDTVSVFTGM